MDILKHAIEVEGNASKLARALGVEPNVVNNWKMRNKLPQPWQIALQLKYGKRKPQPQSDKAVA
jgi:hypothetical protein